MKSLRRGSFRTVEITAFDSATQCWTTAARSGGVSRDELSLTTYNIWFDEYYAAQRHQAITDLLARNPPDVMVFQEVTPEALAIFDAQPWIRVRYQRAAVAGAGVGNYGLLVLSRIPIDRATYTRLPTELDRGFLRVELAVNGHPLTVTALHLESGKANATLRARQLRKTFGALRGARDVVVLGDFNMRDAEDGRIDAGFVDLWPALRPEEPGFTEDTTINLMRWDSKPKQRHVRFDRVLLKGERWTGVDIELLGTAPLSADLPRVFPSDHFGVRCRLAAAPDAAAPQRLRWVRRKRD
jgi:tyrosyl-DNA phosphodiesterase 2